MWKVSRYSVSHFEVEETARWWEEIVQGTEHQRGNCDWEGKAALTGDACTQFDSFASGRDSGSE